MTPDFPIPMDSEQVARLRRAGAVIIGKTHMPEFGSTAASESLRHGATRNPWNLDHSPGGSSSGAAAAVAAGMVPAAHGADGGGSLRIPAASTGLFTVKPTRGRVSLAPQTDITLADSFGFLTHNVRDNALLLDQVAGWVLGDPFWSSPLERTFLEEVGRDVGRLRIGWTAKPPVEVPVHPAHTRALQEAVELCTLSRARGGRAHPGLARRGHPAPLPQGVGELLRVRGRVAAQVRPGPGAAGAAQPRAVGDLDRDQRRAVPGRLERPPGPAQARCRQLGALRRRPLPHHRPAPGQDRRDLCRGRRRPPVAADRHKPPIRGLHRGLQLHRPAGGQLAHRRPRGPTGGGPGGGAPWR